MHLCDIACGKTAKIVSVSLVGEYKNRLTDLGFVPDAPVTCIMKSPLGDPTAYLVRGALIALRYEHSSKILVEVI